MIRAQVPYNEDFWDSGILHVHPDRLKKRRCEWQDLKGVRNVFSVGVGAGSLMPLQILMHDYYGWLKKLQRENMDLRKAVVVDIPDTVTATATFSLFLAAFHVCMDSTLNIEPEGTPPLQYRVTGAGMEHLCWLWRMLDLGNPNPSVALKTLPMEQVYKMDDWYKAIGPPAAKKTRYQWVDVYGANLPFEPPAHAPAAAAAAAPAAHAPAAAAAGPVP